MVATVTALEDCTTEVTSIPARSPRVRVPLPRMRTKRAPRRKPEPLGHEPHAEQEEPEPAEEPAQGIEPGHPESS